MMESYPKSWALYQLGDGTHDLVVIEAISEGVVFNSMPHVSGDYLSAVRPNLSKKAKAQAIYEAFKHLGKPYDFDFDFATDHALVCTELVMRAYAIRENKEGLNVPLLKMAGRMTLPANELAKWFVKQLNDQVQFVLFIDALEKEQKTFFSTEEAFKLTPSRNKWDFAQK